MEDDEQQRLQNFLRYYDLGQYYQGFVNMGVIKLSYLRDVDDADLDKLGLSRPERNRLKKKLESHYSTFGKLKKILKGKKDKFESVAHHNTRPVSPPPPLPLTPAPDPVPTPKESSTPSSPDHSAAVLISPDNIELGEVLGEGAHGAVHRGTYYYKQEQIPVAVKTIFSHHRKGSMEIMFLKEAESMMRLHHPHIIRLHGIVLGTPLMLVQELAPLGSLEDFLRTCRNKVNLGMMLRYACQLADAMAYLEEMKIVHRDLATRNVLLVAEDNVKLSDFGLARVLNKGSIYNLTNVETLLPIGWTAIEALNSGKFSSASDVWSFAVTLWEIYTLGEVPWHRMGPLQVRDLLEAGKRLYRPELCPRDVYEVMLSCWAEEPNERPKFVELYNRLTKLPVRMALVLHPHALDTGIKLIENEMLYIIDEAEDNCLIIMTTDGLTGRVLKDHVEQKTLKTDPFVGISSPPVPPRPASHYQSQIRKERTVSSPKSPINSGSAAAPNKQADNTYMTVVMQSPFKAQQRWEPDPQPYIAPSTPQNFMEASPIHHPWEQLPPQAKEGFDGPHSPPQHAGSVYPPHTYNPTEDNPMKLPSFDAYVQMRPSDFPALTSPTERCGDILSTEHDSPSVSALPPPIIESTEALHAVLYQRADCLVERPPGTADDNNVSPARWSPKNHPAKWVEQPVPSPYLMAQGTDGSAVSAETENMTRSSNDKAAPHYIVAEVTSDLAEMVAKLKTDPDFKDTEHYICERALEKYPNDLEKAKKEIKIDLLLGMGLAYINRLDCERALGHCRWNVERAGMWLMEQSVDIAQRP